eukprot:11341148-Prorocentrum_lima.AAC.1
MVKLKRLQSLQRMHRLHQTVTRDQPLPATVRISKTLVVTATRAWDRMPWRWCLRKDGVLRHGWKQ